MGIQVKHPHLDNPVVNIPVLQVLDSAISGVAAEVSHPLSRLVNVITSILSGENSGNEEARQEPEGEKEADEAEAPMPTLVPTEETEAVEAGDIETRDIETRDSETRDIATRDSETRDIATRNTETSEAGESEVSDAREVVTPFAFTTEQLEVIRAIEGP